MSGPETPLQPASQSAVHRSRLDGSVQPYAVTYPHDYGQVRGKRYRLDKLTLSVAVPKV